MFTGFLAALFIGFFLLALKDLKTALFLLLALLPTYLLRFTLGPVPTNVLEIIVLLVIFVWFFKQKGYRLDFLWTLGVYRVPALLLFSASCFAVAAAPDTYAAIGIWKAFFIEPIMLFFVFRTVFKSREDWFMALEALGVTVVFIALFAVVQRLTGFGIPIPWDVDLRATSVFDFPNAVGLFVAPIVAALVVLWKPRYTLYIVAGIVACVLSETEAVFVAVPAALFLVLMLSTAPTKTKAVVGVVSVALLFGAFFASGIVREKLLLRDTSGQVRLSQWKETANLLIEHPIVGAGLHGYPKVFEKYHDSRLYEIFQYPHNILLNFWVELGFLGVIALIAFILFGAKTMYLRRNDPMALAAFAALLTMGVHGLVDVPFFKNDLAILTVFFLAFTLLPSLESRKEL
jgi:O-antigen ligase